MEMLKAVLGGQIDESSSLVQSMTRLEGKAYHLDLPLSFKDRYKKFSVVSNAQADRLKLGLVYLFSILQQKQNPTIESIYAQVKRKQEMLRVPADIIAGGWRSSPYDFYALALVANCRLALITTSVTGAVVINSYFNPQNKPDIILLWGDGPDLVIDLDGKATHHVNTLPPDLSNQMEQMDRNETSIKKIEQLQVPIESLGSAVVALSSTASAAPAEPVALQVAEERPVPSETVSIAPPSQDVADVLQVAEERPVPSETVSIAPTELAPSPPVETDVDEGFLREPIIPAPASPVEESLQEPAVAFAGIVNDKPEEEAVKIDLPAEEFEEADEAPVQEASVEEAPPQEAQEAPAEEAPAEEAPAEEATPQEAEEAPAEEAQEASAEEATPQEAEEATPQEAQEAPAEEAPQENQENEEWNEEINQIAAAQPTLPQQPPSEQQISRPPPPAS
jgi:hypothetical protein